MMKRLLLLASLIGPAADALAASVAGPAAESTASGRKAASRATHKALTVAPDRAAAPSRASDGAAAKANASGKPGAATARPAAAAKGRIDREFAEEVFAEICRLGIREPQIVMRQAILESGWMRAPYLMRRNNLFAFRYRNYLTFEDWRDSVRYYKDWQDRRMRDSDPDYYAFLTRIKYGAPQYLLHLKKIRWEKECPGEMSPLMPERMSVGEAAAQRSDASLPMEAPMGVPLVEAVLPPEVKALSPVDGSAAPAPPANYFPPFPPAPAPHP